MWSWIAASIQRGRGQLPMPMTASGGIAGAGAGGGRLAGICTTTTPAAPGAPPGARTSARHAASKAPLHDEEAALAVATDDRDQLVAGHPAPGGEVLLDRDLGRGELQQLARPERVDVLADQQEQAVATVEVAAVEPRDGREGVCATYSMVGLPPCLPVPQ